MRLGYFVGVDEDGRDIFHTLATPQDAIELAAFARVEMPSMTFLHDADRWSHRFGDGRTIRDSWTLVLRDRSASGELIGFAWVDDAMFVDAKILEPWWCINAVAVASKHRRRRLGGRLVAEILNAASAAGVVLVYGQSLPAAVEFWQNSGFLVGAEGEPLRAHNAAQRSIGDPVMLTLPPDGSDRWFVRYTTDRPGSVRSGLLPASLAGG